MCLGENDIVLIWWGNVFIYLGLTTYLDVCDLVYGLKWMEDVAGKQSAGVNCSFFISVSGSEIISTSSTYKN